MSNNFWQSEIKNLSHHAYGIFGDIVTLRKELLVVLERDHRFMVKANPDFFQSDAELFTVDEARSLKEKAQGKSMSAGKKIFVVSCHGMTAEAQNALLKIFEEPSPETFFFLLLPSAHVLFPTIKSRLMMFEVGGEQSSRISVETARSFLTSSISERMAFVKKMVDEVALEKKTKADVAEFVRSLEVVAAKDRLFVVQNPNNLKMLLDTSRNVSLSGASLKMLLEEISLLLPRFS